MKRYIRANEIIPNGKIQPGMYWISDGFTKTCISRSGDTCKIQEEWIAEDTGRHKKVTYTCKIMDDGKYGEFAYDPKYSEYALSDDESKNWFARNYASGAANYPWEYESKQEDYEEYEDYDDPYTPSATAGDYGPGNPWDAPGYSIRDFI